MQSSNTLILAQLVAIWLPLALVAWWSRAYPSRRLVKWAAVPALLSLLVLLADWLLWPVAVLDAALAVAAAIDAFSLPARRWFAVERHAGRVASLGKRHAVSIGLAHRAARPHTVWVRDDAAADLCPQPAEFGPVRLWPTSRTTFDYHLRPRRRGAFVLGRVYLRVASRWGLWHRLLEYPLETSIHVYPDMKQLAEYALLARTNRLSQLGVRRARRVGEDHDFERLRDYTRDDNYRHMDWRATARRRKLTVKDFQASQSQRVIFLVDCGRMMTNEAAGLSLLDHALNAVLMLSYVALRQNDGVGLICFSDEIHAFVPIRGGMNQMNRLLHASFDRFPRLVESRYDAAFQTLNARVRKRSLVVLVTNVIDAVNARQVEQYLTNLVGRHLPLGVFLRDRRVFEAVESEQSEGPAFWRAAAAADILGWRQQAIADLTRQGSLVLDVFPEEMTAPLVNRYLEVKARHLL